MKIEGSYKGIGTVSETISYSVLGLHLYYRCYWAFDHWGLTSRFSDEILGRFVVSGLLGDFKGRMVILFFLVLALASSPGRKVVGMSSRACWRLVAAGVVLLWCSPLIFVRSGGPLTTCLSYLVVTVAGYLFLLTGGGRLLRILRLPWDKNDPFGRKQAGFPQEQRQISGKQVLHLRMEHIWKNERRESWINLINPRRGILILGSPGSGKSWFIIEPLMRQLIAKGQALFVYDFKFPALTSLAYRDWQLHRDKYPSPAKFYCIQFGDLSRSHRCNVLEPSTLQWVSDALGAARTILLSINRTWINKQGEFFVESPVNFLGAVIWYLRKFEDGKYCTLPHAIELAQAPYERLFALLDSDPELKALIEPFMEAYRNKTFQVLDSMIASARIPLARLASPDLYFVLTGDDLDLAINDPAAPKILCLGGDPPRQEALAPVLSLYIDRLNRLCNQSGRYPCALICDEFATVRAYSMTTTLATGRANQIVSVIAVQDLSQLRGQYTRDEADLFLNISGNVLCGAVGGETARWMSERFPRIQQEKPSISANSVDTSVSTTLQWEPTVSQATIASLSSGEFVGVLSDEPENRLEMKVFHGRIVREGAASGSSGQEEEFELPVVREVDARVVKENFERIKEDINVLVAAEFHKHAPQEVVEARGQPVEKARPAAKAKRVKEPAQSKAKGPAMGARGNLKRE